MPRHSTENERSRSKRHAEKLMLAGLCVVCKSPNDRKTRRCASCTQKAVELNRRTKQEALRSRLCATCRKPWTGTTKNCQECKDISRVRWANRADGTLCTRCMLPKDGPHKACDACRKEMLTAANRRRAKFAAEGRCVQCGNMRSGPSLYCDDHILKAAARRWLGDVKRWRELASLLTKQNSRCAYTGEILVLGGNASVDHKIPRSRGGTNTIENVHWITWTVNRVKNDLTHVEFLALCRCVVDQQTAHL
jgi:hypothetical protein